jgi:hypothetical protein
VHSQAEGKARRSTDVLEALALELEEAVHDAHGRDAMGQQYKTRCRQVGGPLLSATLQGMSCYCIASPWWKQ